MFLNQSDANSTKTPTNKSTQKFPQINKLDEMGENFEKRGEYWIQLDTSSVTTSLKKQT